MAEPNRKNRLSPPLMFIFRAAHAARDAKSVAAQKLAAGVDANPTRSRQARRIAVTEQTLRREVARDLEMLMNCVAMESTVDLTDFPAVRKSILNYGFPDIAHRTIDELAVSDLNIQIEAVLKLYEPRLIPSSLRVVRDKSVDPDELKIRYFVYSDLSCEPLNVPLQFVADIEATTGKIQFHRL